MVKQGCMVKTLKTKIFESISKKLVIFLQEIKHAVQGIFSAHQDDVLDHRISQIDVSYFRWLFRSELFEHIKMTSPKKVHLYSGLFLLKPRFTTVNRHRYRGQFITAFDILAKPGAGIRATNINIIQCHSKVM